MSKYLKVKYKDALDYVADNDLDPFGTEYHNPMDEIQEQQAREMLHAIGADHKKAREYMGHLTYHAYRNYYDAGGSDIDLWNDLVDKGFADKRRFYHVSVEGLMLLEKLTGATIYDNYDCVGDCKTRMLESFMKHDVYCGWGCWFPTSAKQIANNLKIPVELARETARYLEKKGYIKKTHYGGMDEEGYPYCIHGYGLTDKARQMEMWKVLHDQEVAYLNNEVLNETCK